MLRRMVGAVGAAVLVGCGVGEVSVENDDALADAAEVAQGLAANQGVLGVQLTGLEPLGPGWVYEGWLIVNGAPLSAGRFSLTTATVNRARYFVGSVALLSRATAYVLTIEPERNDDPAPSKVHVLAGNLPAAGKRRSSSLTMSHTAAFGQNFAAVSGQFMLATPSSPSMDDSQLGIWFIDPRSGAPMPSLALPSLPEGWVYEGWVVTSSGPLSTGRFASVTGADDDGAGPTAGPNPGPPFPGQDFIQPPVNLRGKTIVISVEPQPDDSPKPFAIKPLQRKLATNAAVAPVLHALSRVPVAESIKGVAAIYLP